MPSLSVIDLAMFALETAQRPFKLQIGFLAMPKAVPHVDKLAAYTVDAFNQLKHAKRKP